MFSGIIEAKGKISDLSGHSISFIVDAPLTDLNESDSIMVDGACLTITNASNEGHRFTVDIVSETLKRTNLGQLSINDSVNLERSVKYGDRISGHLVQGHVDGTGKILSKSICGGETTIEIRLNEKYMKYCIYKGSICLDGISLTISNITDNSISLAIIPYTLENTTLSFKCAGDFLNVETDMFAKYVEKIYAGEQN